MQILEGDLSKISNNIYIIRPKWPKMEQNKDEDPGYNLWK